jgi:predicted outer membrane repeat protein
VKSVSRYLLLFTLLFFGLLLAACDPGVPCPSEYLVTKPNDTNDGICDADCSIREAVINANACAGAQSIRIPADAYQLTITGTGEDAAATGDLDITDDLTIIGDAVPSIDANGIDRIFEVHPGVTVEMQTMILSEGQEQLGAAIRNHGTLTLRGLSIQNNHAVVPPGGSGSSAGGGLFNEAGTTTLNGTQFLENSADHGGGVENFATATLNGNNVMFAGNTATMTAGGLWNNTAADVNLTDVEFRMNESNGDAGGLYNAGDVEMTQVTFTENTATANGGAIATANGSMTVFYDANVNNNSADLGGGLYNEGLTHFYTSSLTINTAFGGLGGAIYNDNANPGVLLRNTTVSGNMLVPPGTPGGGGIYNDNGDVLIEFSTLAYNGPDGIYNNGGGHFTIENSIVAYHAAANCTNPGSPSIGYNIESDDTCNLIEPSDMVSTDPLLQPLGLNGATTLSHALTAGSPALDSATLDTCTSQDQRHVSRPQGPQCDRGAFEDDTGLAGPTPTPTPAAEGGVSGLVCYPSEGIPPLNLYFANVNSNAVHEFDHSSGDSNYNVSLPPGTYVAYAWTKDFGVGGSYSEAVPCGLTVNCTDHTLIEFDVFSNQTTTGVDICDYYGGQNSVPLPPNAQPGPLTVLAVFMVNANCREGPDTRYDVVTSLLAGDQAVVHGQGGPNYPNWKYIELPNVPGAFCWISDSTVQYVGPVGEVPVITPPPLPRVPNAPSGLSIQRRVCSSNGFSLRLVWGDNSNNEDGFNIYRNSQLIATVGPNVTAYNDTPPMNTSLVYTVEAFNSAGASAQDSTKDDGCTIVN